MGYSPARWSSGGQRHRYGCLSTVEPTAPGSSASVAMQAWQGASHKYILWKYNDAGTERYISIGPLDSVTAASITKGTSATRVG